MRLGEFVGRAERALQHISLHDVFQLGAHKRSAFPGLDMLEIHDYPNLAVNLNRQAFFKISGRYHIFSSNQII